MYKKMQSDHVTFNRRHTAFFIFYYFVIGRRISDKICLKYATVSIKFKSDLPPEALKCPPPLKYCLEKLFTSKFPLLLKDNLTSSTRSVINVEKSMPRMLKG